MVHLLRTAAKKRTEEPGTRVKIGFLFQIQNHVINLRVPTHSIYACTRTLHARKHPCVLPRICEGSGTGVYDDCYCPVRLKTPEQKTRGQERSVPNYEDWGKVVVVASHFIPKAEAYHVFAPSTHAHAHLRPLFPPLQKNTERLPSYWTSRNRACLGLVWSRHPVFCLSATRKSDIEQVT